MDLGLEGGEVGVCAEGEWSQVFLFLDSDYHLLEIVRCDVPFAATTSTVNRILSPDVRMCDVERC